MADQWGIVTELPYTVTVTVSWTEGTAVCERTALVLAVDLKAYIRLRDMPSSTQTHRAHTITAQFSSLAQVPAFLLGWQRVQRVNQLVWIHPHSPRIVNTAADWLAVQEWHYATEGMDMDS
eukprot:100330-Rhodomonas_salina.1